MIVERSAGNPFFAEEIVWELAERGVLQGAPGDYVSTRDVAGVSLPATVQATIAARIDRLDPAAKRSLSAAAVIGAKFSRDLLQTLGIEPALEELARGQFIDQVAAHANMDTPTAEFVFHHPLIRAVAYESQLKSDRAELHRRLAAAIEQRDPASAEEHAALIAEHLGRQAICTRPTTGTCGPDDGRPSAISEQPRPTGSKPARSPTSFPPTTPNGWRCRSRRAPALRQRLPHRRYGRRHRVRRVARPVRRRGRQVVPGHRHDRVPDGADLQRPHHRIGAAGRRMRRTDRFDGRARPRRRAPAGALLAHYQSGQADEAMRLAQRIIDLAEGDATMGNLVFGSPSWRSRRSIAPPPNAHWDCPDSASTSTRPWRRPDPWIRPFRIGCDGQVLVDCARGVAIRRHRAARHRGRPGDRETVR